MTRIPLQGSEPGQLASPADENRSNSPAGRLPLRVIALNVTAMYALFATSFLTSALMLPFLTRRLGPGALGQLSVAQSLGFVIAVIIEYGFNYHGAREIASLLHRNINPAAMAANIYGAKALLLIALLPVYCGCALALPALRGNLLLNSANVLWIVAQSATPVWLFQGLGRIKQFTTIEVGCRVLGTVAVIATVQRPSDAWLVQFCIAAGTLISAAINLKSLQGHLTIKLPRFRGAAAQLRLAWTSFAYRLTGAIAGQANPVLMSVSASAVNVGLYSVSDKLVRLCINALQPMSEAVYPFMFRTGADNSRKLFFYLLAANAALGFVCAGLLYILAAPLVAVVGGKSFLDSANSLRTLAACIPFAAVNQVIILYELVRGNRGVAFSFFAVTSLATQASSAIYLSHKGGHVGMAQAILLTHVSAFVTLCAIVALMQRSRTHSALRQQTENS
jgi:PST family polysaccharide transporter